jgi:hypothetical protein
MEQMDSQGSDMDLFNHSSPQVKKDLIGGLDENDLKLKDSKDAKSFKNTLMDELNIDFDSGYENSEENHGIIKSRS